MSDRIPDHDPHGRFGVWVASGEHAGASVAEGGIPWRGSRQDALAMADHMAGQARLYGHDATYLVDVVDGAEVVPA